MASAPNSRHHPLLPELEPGRLRPHVQVGEGVGDGRHVRAARVEDRHEVARIQARGTLQVQPLESPPFLGPSPGRERRGLRAGVLVDVPLLPDHEQVAADSSLLALLPLRYHRWLAAHRRKPSLNRRSASDRYHTLPPPGATV